LGHHVPRLVAAHVEGQALLAADRLHAATPRRILALQADGFLAERGRLVVDDAGLALDEEARPRLTRRVALPRRELHAAAADLQRLHVDRAHGLGHALERGACALRLA